MVLLFLNSTSISQSMVASAINKRSKEQYKVSESKIKSNIAFALTSAVNERQKEIYIPMMNNYYGLESKRQ